MGHRLFAAAALVWTAMAAPSASAENLVLNGSFEAGIDYRFAIGRWYVDGLPSAKLDTTTKVHGGASLKIPFSRSATAINRRVTGINVRSAIPVSLRKGQRYTFSVYVKSSPPARGRLLLTRNGTRDSRFKPSARKDIRISTNWRRVSLSYTPKEDEKVYWSVRGESGKPGNLWIDALQISTGFVRDFAPAASIEAGLVSDRLGYIFDPSETPSVNLIAYNDAAKASPPERFQIDVFEYEGGKVYSTTIERPIPAKGRITVKVPLPVKRRGLFRAVLTRPGSKAPESELHFTVLPKPRPIEARHSAFGAYGTIAPEPLALMRRIGFSWIATLTSNSFMSYWDKVERKRGQFHWYDDLVDEAKAAGFELVFNLEPCRIPRWAKGMGREERRRLWANFVRATVRHYGDRVTHWIVGDEVADLRKKSPKRKCWDNAAEYALWHQAGYDAIKAEDPNASVILNAWPGFLKPLFETLDPKTVDVLSANGYHVPEPFLVRFNREAEPYNFKRKWAPGIGFWIESYYMRHALPRKVATYKADMWRKTNRKALRGVVKTIGLGYERILNYTATYVGNTNNYTLFEADSSLRPIGAQFAALTWLLDGYRAAREIETPLRGKELRVHRIDRRDGKTVFAIWAGILRDQRLRLRIGASDAAGAVLYDNFTNRLPVRATQTGVELRFGKEAAFLLVDTRQADAFTSAFETARYAIGTLPKAGSVQKEGRYAVIRDLADGVRRPKPNVSLWYRSDGLGWVEIMRHRASNLEGRYRATKDGFEASWNVSADAGAFFIGLGKLPTDLFDGAQVISREPGRSGTITRVGRLSAGKEVRLAPARNGGRALTDLRDVRYLFRTRNGLQIAVDPEPPGVDRKRLARWKLYSRGGGDLFLHRYFHKGSAPPQVKTRIVVSEPS